MKLLRNTYSNKLHTYVGIQDAKFVRYPSTSHTVVMKVKATPTCSSNPSFHNYFTSGDAASQRESNGGIFIQNGPELRTLEIL